MSHVGKMLLSLREERGISQAQLAKGITSVTKLSRIEAGESEADWFLLQALFQRLGKSIDKLELAVSYEEYHLYDLKMQSLQQLLAGKSIEKNLEKYEREISRKEKLQVQSYLQLKAANEFLEKKDEKLCIGQLQEALKVTFKEWKEGWEKNYLCIQEIEIMLMILYLLKDSQPELERVTRYIDIHFSDEEERVKIYPKCAWMLARTYYFQGRIAKAYDLLKSGEECLAENGSLTFMMQTLELEIKCLEKLDRIEEKEVREKYLEAIHYLDEITGNQSRQEPFFLLMVANQQSEVVISNELIKELRISQNLSQEELGADICEQETLSRIENGKRSPNRSNFYKMLDRMNLERRTYYGFIIAEDYALYEKVRKYNRAIGKGELTEAQSLLRELEAKLDLTQTVNRQFIEAGKYSVSQTDCKEYEKAIHELQKILAYTMPEHHQTLPRTPFRLEFMILNKIALYLKRMKRKNEAIEIYEQIMQKYKSSHVRGECHVVSNALLYVNYVGILEEADRLEEAEKVGLEGLYLMNSCQRGDFAGQILANFSCIYEKESDKKEKAERCLKSSVYLLSLYKYEKSVSILKNAYEKLYSKQL
ncbi:MAG: helix-turn-helix transcriptional regulator [Roseburia sp.]